MSNNDDDRRITNTLWQALGGIRPGTSSPGGRPVDRRSAHPCHDCGRAMWAHDRERVYPDDGPAGSYHYEYRCPGGDGP